MTKGVLGTVVGFLLCLTPGAVSCAEPGPRELAAAHEAQDRGAQMFRYDRAAWYATDRFQADLKRAGMVPEDPTLALSGYIVEPASNGRLQVSFYSGDGGSRVARARYLVDADAHAEGGLLGEGADGTISALASRLISARDAALRQAIASGYQLCSSSPANTLVLPPDARGLVSVYLLTSTTDVDSYPAGGHYRVDVAQGGQVVAQRAFMKSCFPIDVGSARKGRGKVQAMVLSHLLDPQPTEIHAFVGLNIGFPLMILTVSNQFVWSVSDGRISFEEDVSTK